MAEHASNPNSQETGTNPTGGIWDEFLDSFRTLRKDPPFLMALAMGSASILLVLVAWIFVTQGAEPESRIISPVILPSPLEIVQSFPSLWYERALSRSLVYSLGRVLAGFAIAASIGIPLGILAASFRPVNAFLTPFSLFGRNIPIAALIPLTILWFGTGEPQKVTFIFIASVAFVLYDATRSVSDVEDRFLDTAYTLGASRTQVIMKVLIPLALPDIFNSLRSLFGLAFGYIMLAEVIDPKYGLGDIIVKSQRIAKVEHVILVLILIALVAFLIDRTLFWCQCRLFPYRYQR